MQIVDNNYYPLGLDFKFYKRYLIWVSDDVDTVVTDDQSQIIAFETEGGLLRYADKSGIVLNEDKICYAVYRLQQWILKQNKRPDFELMLNFWNLCTDLSQSVGKAFSGDIKDEVRNSVYDKLFNASDTFISDEPNPSFTDEEMEILISVLEDGFKLLTENMIVLN